MQLTGYNEVIAKAKYACNQIRLVQEDGSTLAKPVRTLADAKNDLIEAAEACETLELAWKKAEKGK